MKPPIFVDTNVIDNAKAFDRLFGNRAELERVSHQYQICIPRAVYDELIRHKENEFKRQKNELEKSGVAKLAGLDVATIRSLSFDSVKQSIKESIPYTICEMEEASVFHAKYYPLAITHSAPFSKGSDKGYKDACIASAIRKFLADNDANCMVVLVTDDNRLAECFETDEAVTVYPKLNDALKNYAGSQQLGNVVGAYRDEQHVEERKELVRTYDMEKAISDLCGSRSFLSTHQAIERLFPYQGDLSAQEKARILRAATDNDQISWILADEDVDAFLRPIFDELSDCLDNNQYFTYVDAVGLPNNRLDENGNVQFSRSERQSFQAFADALIGHIQKRYWDSTISTDADAIRDALVNLLAMSTLDETLLSWSSIADVFISGGVFTDEGVAQKKIVSDFVDLLRSSSEKKQDVIIQGLASRLQMLDLEMPF